jgi:ADP-heptose:LPS heptosyltransferase
MKIETMRKIDFGVGVPLSFILSCLKFLLPARRASAHPNKKILFIELSEMGSAILADPAMQKAKNHYRAEIHFVIFKRNKASLDFLRSVPEENIFTIEDTSLFKIIRDSIGLFFWCQSRGIEATIDLELFSRATALLTFLTRSPIKAGFHNYFGEGLYRGNFMNRKVAYNPHIHIAKNFVALVDAVFTAEEQVPYLKKPIADSDIKIRQIEISAEARRNVTQSIQKLYPAYKPGDKVFLVNPNASEFLPQRKWPLANYTELIRIVLERHPDYLILMTGSPQEKEEIESIAQAVGSARCINFAGKVPFNQLTALYDLSRVLITNDSGPGHFSSVTKIRSFVFFGPETPLLYGSLGRSTALYAQLACSPCVSAYNHRKTPCTDNQCLKVLKPDWVYQQISESLLNE